MKIQVAIFNSTQDELERDINQFLLSLDPDMFVDIKYSSRSEHDIYTQAMIIYKII